MLVIFIIYILNMLIIFTINKNKKKINAQIERIIISQTVIVVITHGNILRSFILLYPAGHNIIINNRSFYFNPIGLTPFEPRDCRVIFVYKNIRRLFRVCGYYYSVDVLHYSTSPERSMD